MTRLKSININEFRGFYDKQTINVANPNGTPGSGLTVIVGPNNSGKTTVLEVIKRFYVGNPPQFDREERHQGKNVAIELINSNEESRSLTTSDSALGNLTGEAFYPTKDNFFIISSRRYFETYFSPEKINHSQHRDTSYTLQKSGGDSNFGRRMIEISNSPDSKGLFDTLMKKLIPHFSTWNIELSRGTNYIRYVTGGNDEHSSELFGDGVISLFKISAALITGTEEEILVIDEPELSLHPQAQKALSLILREYSTNKQILVTTHSPLFINWQDIENGAEIIRLNKLLDKKCTVNALSSPVKATLLQYIEDWRKPQLLDTVAKEIFFSEKVVFVEGLEDMSLISRFIKQQNLKIVFEIFGYGAGGASNIKTLLQMTKDLGIRAGAIFDGKETALIEEAKALFPEPYCLIEKISTDDIRDKAEKGINGIFNESAEIKPEHVDELKEILEKFNQFFI